jgi:hypothetical protein
MMPASSQWPKVVSLAGPASAALPKAPAGLETAGTPRISIMLPSPQLSHVGKIEPVRRGARDIAQRVGPGVAKAAGVGHGSAANPVQDDQDDSFRHNDANLLRVGLAAEASLPLRGRETPAGRP